MVVLLVTILVWNVVVVDLDVANVVVVVLDEKKNPHNFFQDAVPVLIRPDPYGRTVNGQTQHCTAEYSVVLGACPAPVTHLQERFSSFSSPLSLFHCKR